MNIELKPYEIAIQIGQYKLVFYPTGTDEWCAWVEKGENESIWFTVEEMEKMVENLLKRKI